MLYALSIDVGTTFTAAAIWRDGRASTLTLGDHADAIPSVLYLRDEDGTFLVGAAAERRAIADPGRVAREFKRRMGDDVPMVLGDQEFTSTELTGHVIRWVADLAAGREGSPPSHVTLTCPASWGDYRRRLMTEAASVAGLDAVGVMTEPGAAATYYASLNRLEPGATIAVYDFGGGTFDAAVLAKTTDGFDLRGVPDGNNELGGVNFDAAVMRMIAADAGITFSPFEFAYPIAAAAQAQLHARAVDAKEALSTDLFVDVPVIMPGMNRTVRITRERFEDAVRDDVLETVDKLRETVEHADVEPAMLSAVLLVGGSSRIPLVAELVRAELGVRTVVDAHPKLAVCLGAAIAAATRVSSPRASRAPALTRPAVPAPQGGSGTPTPGDANVEGPPGLSSVDGGQVAVDLVAAGLTTPLDSPVTPEPAPWVRRRAVSREEPLVVRLAEISGDGRTSSRLKVRLILLILGSIVLISVALWLANLW